MSLCACVFSHEFRRYKCITKRILMLVIYSDTVSSVGGKVIIL